MERGGADASQMCLGDIDREAGRIQPGNGSSDAGSRDGVARHSQPLEGPQHAQVGEPLGAPFAECEPDPEAAQLSCDPAKGTPRPGVESQKPATQTRPVAAV